MPKRTEASQRPTHPRRAARILTHPASFRFHAPPSAAPPAQTHTTMVFDARAEAAVRQKNAAKIEASLRATGDAMQAMHAVNKRPVPYTSTCEVPVLQTPLPEDAHLVPSGNLVTKKGLGDVVMSGKHSSRGALQKEPPPWATFSMPAPNVFEPSKPATPASDAGAAAGDNARREELLLTRHNEWNLQRNNYNPDIAAQMRCAPASPRRAPAPARPR